MMRAVCCLLLVAAACGGGGDDATAKQVTWMTDEKAAFDRARADGKNVMIDVRSDWCAPCQDLDDKTFSDPKVAAWVHRHFVPLRLDVTRVTPEDEAIMERYRAQELPAVIFKGADGRELGRFHDFKPPDQFLAAGKTILAGR